MEYGYTLQAGAANVVTTKRLGPTGTQITSYTLFDGLLRAADQGRAGDQRRRVVTDTSTTRGLTVKTRRSGIHVGAGQHPGHVRRHGGE
jgi:hypothetical protein